MNDPIVKPPGSLLLTLQQRCYDRLKGINYFAKIPVVTEYKHDIEQELKMALGKLGVAVLILTPEASVNLHQDCPFPFFDKITIVVQIAEHPVVNRATTGLHHPASEVAEMVALHLHNWKPTDFNEIYLDNPSITLVPDETFLVYQVRLATAAGIQGA